MMATVDCGAQGHSAWDGLEKFDAGHAGIRRDGRDNGHSKVGWAAVLVCVSGGDVDCGK